MEQFFFNFDQYLNLFPFKGYELVFLAAAIESLAFIGALFPGTVIFVAIGLFAYLGYLKLYLVFPITIIGALLGDLISYYVGKRKGLELKLGQKSIFKYLYLPEAGDFLLANGGLSIITGRIFGPTRAFVPFYMGAAGEKERKFIIYDIIGVTIWASFYLFLGYAFGDSYNFLKHFMNTVELVVIALILFIVGPLIIARIFRKKVIKPQTKIEKEKI
jgi:membrane protein DedA with SNARE-associated domain